ncbi:MAG: Xanthine/uracil/thiamine/ascorbate permease family protein [uncultured Acidimicrobiales bacterium]|uniref:Xanthine/uracil/thiamine/ascorbate permease family protein n=1 Tax=uncultured Acidimicrobiales bacterium TaxID=310071 RepID=A0A6J4GXX6_9ACTN|nr:MAG: Xanthine/uracil/thiamine/ascorbate permease family protein [uncultured Acidimicrobiales bacterium]
MEALDRYFGITDRGSSVRAEVRGGLATFFTMAYIVVLNPIILSAAPDVNGNSLSFAQVTTVTALVAAVMTLLMGIVGRYPFAIAAGLGLNGVVAFQLASVMSWPAAMGVVVIEGIIITVLVLTGFRRAVFDAIPLALKQSISVGIGLFIAFIGFVDAGFVRRSPDAANTPVPVGLGVGGRLVGWPTLVFAFGLLLTAILVARKVRGGILIGIVGTTVFAMIVQALFKIPAAVGPDGATNPRGWQLNVPDVPDQLFALPDFGLLGQFSLTGSFVQVGVLSAILFVFTLMLADFFDTMGTVVGVGSEAGLLDEEGKLPGVQRVLFVDSVAAVAGGAASASSNTSYIESAAGVADGARTGLANVVTGALFLVALFVSPLVEIVPYEAASPALVVVGFLLMTQVKHIPWDDYDIAIPAFLTIVLMPFTYSITNGIGAGFISYAVIKLARGRARDVHPLLWLIAALFVVYFGIDAVERALGL